ncbi:permease prefix domain 1-containing protein [Microlunatus parietis]|uniref:Uncharacterized protein n=1 Tax=Microlunatus parietis TaxID=682979 RepID=A0A7Y9IDV1_9ACTN|nr:permease prefix domain 1-containing protein [Microlunatus parietis]NYE75123.1 hypothetical protein [Microlunatus parietis]
MASYTERYVAAATRTVPEHNRADLRAELQASIADAIEARTENGEDHATAEHAVLTGLGDPDRLAAGYAERRNYLIGPELYRDWLRMLKLLLWAVLPVAVVGVIVRAATGASGGEIIGATVTSMLTVGVHVAFWTTLFFVILERAGVRSPSAPWTVEQLPDVRPEGAVARTDLVATLIFLAVMIGAVLWDRFEGFVQIGGQGVPVLNPQLWSAWIGVLLAILAAETIFAIVLYRNRWWTPALAVANAAIAIAAGAVGLFLTSTGVLFNSAFFDIVAVGDPAGVRQVATGVVAAGFVIVAVWDIADGVIKTVRRRRG